MQTKMQQSNKALEGGLIQITLFVAFGLHLTLWVGNKKSNMHAAFSVITVQDGFTEHWYTWPDINASYTFLVFIFKDFLIIFLPLHTCSHTKNIKIMYILLTHQALLYTVRKCTSSACWRALRASPWETVSSSLCSEALCCSSLLRACSSCRLRDWHLVSSSSTRACSSERPDLSFSSSSFSLVSAEHQEL